MSTHSPDGTRAQDELACDICGQPAMTLPYLEVDIVDVCSAQIVACSNCGFKQVRPRITRAELTQLYPTSYFDPKLEIGFGDYARQQQVQEREAYFLARRLRKIAPTGRFLEVGCAMGFLLEGLKRFSDWQCEGVDISGFAAYYAENVLGARVRRGTLDEAQYPDETFDYVLQKDLLEHVRSPREHLLETRRILRRGGYLKIITPNGRANLNPMLVARESADANGGQLPLMTQAHLSFFARPHLYRLFEECGFEVVKFRNIHIRRGLRALGYLHEKPRKRVRLAPRPPSRERLMAGVAAAGPDEDARPQGRAADAYAALAEQLNADIEARRRPARASRPYFYLRHGQHLLGSLPPALTFGFDPGLDFEFVVRRR